MRVGAIDGLAQKLKSAVQAEAWVCTIAVPFLKALPAVTDGKPPKVGVTSTVVVWLAPVQSNDAPPMPTATSLPARSVTFSPTLPVVPAGPEQLTVTETSMPAPLATRVAGEFTWTCTTIGSDDCPTAGPAGPSKAAAAAPPATVTPARAIFTLAGNSMSTPNLAGRGCPAAHAVGRLVDLVRGRQLRQR